MIPSGKPGQLLFGSPKAEDRLEEPEDCETHEMTPNSLLKVKLGVGWADTQCGSLFYAQE